MFRTRRIRLCNFFLFSYTCFRNWGSFFVLLTWNFVKDCFASVILRSSAPCTTFFLIILAKLRSRTVVTSLNYKSLRGSCGSHSVAAFCWRAWGFYCGAFSPFLSQLLKKGVVCWRAFFQSDLNGDFRILTSNLKKPLWLLPTLSR